MSQTVREIAAEINADYESRMALGQPVTYGLARSAVLADHVLASTEPLAMTGIDNGSAEAEARDRISERGFAQYERECADLREQLKKSTEPMGDEKLERVRDINRRLIGLVADLRDQLQAAGQEAAHYLDACKSVQQLADERVAALEYWQNRAQYWKDRGAQYIEAASQIGVVFSKSADGIKADNPSADERGREVERLRVALKRNRQGYQNILEFRKLDSANWGMRDGYGGRYGALTREEIETVISEIDSALATPAATPPEAGYCSHGVPPDAPCVVCVPTGSNMARIATPPAEFHITPEEAIEYATDEEIGEIPRPNIPPAQEHPDMVCTICHQPAKFQKQERVWRHKPADPGDIGLHAQTFCDKYGYPIEVTAATPPAHVYTSTACQHGLHDRCRNNCKFCGVGCACSCHATEATPPAQEHPDTAAGDTGPVANHPPFIFDRYRNGVRMAEGAKIHHAATPEEAEAIARKLFEREESYPWGYTGPCTDEFRPRDKHAARTSPEAQR